MKDDVPKIVVYRALVEEVLEDGKLLHSQTVTVSVDSRLLERGHGEHLLAAVIWWKYLGQLHNLEWRLMQAEPHTLLGPDGDGVLMVSEGARGNNELVYHERASLEYIIFDDLECQIKRASVRILVANGDCI